jgi:hypothetical protein
LPSFAIAGKIMLSVPNFPSPTPHQAHNPNNYGRALLSAPPQAIAPNPHTNLLNVYIQIANKLGFKKNFLLLLTLIMLWVIFVPA